MVAIVYIACLSWIRNNPRGDVQQAFNCISPKPKTNEGKYIKKKKIIFNHLNAATIWLDEMELGMDEEMLPTRRMLIKAAKNNNVIIIDCRGAEQGRERRRRAHISWFELVLLSVDYRWIRWMRNSRAYKYSKCIDRLWMLSIGYLLKPHPEHRTTKTRSTNAKETRKWWYACHTAACVPDPNCPSQTIGRHVCVCAVRARTFVYTGRAGVVWVAASFLVVLLPIAFSHQIDKPFVTFREMPANAKTKFIPFGLRFVIENRILVMNWERDPFRCGTRVYMKYYVSSML